MCQHNIKKERILNCIKQSPNFLGLSAKEMTIKANIIWKKAQGDSVSAAVVCAYINKHSHDK